MHGVARVRTTEEEKIRKKKERDAEIVSYKSQMEKIFQKRSQLEYDEETLKLCGDILLKNPDLSSIWNFRREIILSKMPESIENEDEELSKMFDTEFLLTESCLKVNPKSYCAWFHRIWVLQTRKTPDWNRELAICNAYLKVDERNFHCWDYRNYIISKTNQNLDGEFQYCTKKIEENFSNYSAWHHRSKLLPKIYPSPDGTNIIEENKYIEELELVINAAFTDPNDTSAFFYQMWLLMSPQKDITMSVTRVTSTKTYVAFNRSVNLINNDWKVEIYIDSKEVIGVWKSLHNLKHDVLWILEHTKMNIQNANCIESVLKHSDNIVNKILCDDIIDGEYVGYSSITFDNGFGSSTVDKLISHQESCEQLLELEPDSKWTYFTLAVILHSIDHLKNYDSCNKILNKLMILDPKRINYFQDIMSRWHIEYLLQTNMKIVKDGKFFINPSDSELFKLSSLYYIQYWSSCTFVDLKDNVLLSINIRKLSVLQNCQILDLRNNRLDSLSGFPELPKLHTLFLDGNNISVDDLKHLKVCKNLRIVYNCNFDLDNIQNDLYSFAIQSSV